MIDAIEELLPKKKALKHGWSQQKILAARGKAPSSAVDEQSSRSATVKLHEVDEAIRSHIFWSYMQMLQLCGRAIQHVTAWSEGCPCHTTHRSQHDSLGFITKRSAVHNRCPMASRRAPEAAAGHLLRCIEDALRAVNSSLLLSSDFVECGDVERAAILADLGAARRHILLQFHLKLGHWCQNPWRLCALAHPDPQVQREAAVSCLQLFAHAGDVADHHWLTYVVCSPEQTAGQQLRLLASGQAALSCHLRPLTLRRTGPTLEVRPQAPRGQAACCH